MAEPSINTIEDLDIETKILMLKGEKGDPGGATWGDISGDINSQTDLKTALDAKANTSDLGDVCFSNSYNDLSNKPTYATVATTGSYNDLTNKPVYADVATTGSYNNLSDKPLIPTKTSQLTNNSEFLTPATLLDYVYPVGSYYWSSNSTNPSTIFGGTWEQIKDKFVLAAGDSYAVNTTGGEARHTLSESEMPSHNHDAFMWFQGAAGGLSFNSWCLGGAGGSYGPISTEYRGGSQSHNNMPPYITAYCWHRTA